MPIDEEKRGRWLIYIGDPRRLSECTNRYNMIENYPLTCGECCPGRVDGRCCLGSHRNVVYTVYHHECFMPITEDQWRNLDHGRDD